MKKITITLLAGLLLSVNLSAQSIQSVLQNAYIQFHDQLQTPSFIEFPANNGIKGLDVLTTLAKDLGIDPADQFILRSNQTDELGFPVLRFDQYHNGIRVEGGEYVVSEKNGSVNTLAGYYFKDIKATETNPTLNALAALEYAKKFIGARTYQWEDINQENFLKITQHNPNATYYPIPSSEVVYAAVLGNHSNPVFKLCYKLDVYAAEPLGRYFIYVDAKNGTIVNNVSRIHVANATGTANTKYNGTRSITADSYSGAYRMRTDASSSTGRKVETYNLNNGTNYSSATEYTDADNVWTADQVANSCHWGALSTYDYYKTTFNRSSFNGGGAAIQQYVHYSSNYVNAFWDGSKMTYGDGDGSSYSALVSIDVCGHEISHAFTQYTSNLAYQNESGALNESFSDIFGETIEDYGTGSHDWKVGADFDIAYHQGFRSFTNPNSEGQPDTYKGTNWVASTPFPNSTINDNGGVHTNSGVQNFWFYLLTVGGSGTNDNGNAYSVTGIGMAKAAAIAFRNNTVKLTSSATFADARTGAISAARDLYGTGSTEEAAVTNAWYAVGVGAAYSGPAPCSTPASLSSSSVTSSSATLSWATVSGAASYNVRYRPTSTSTWTTTSSSTTSVSVSGLSASTTYEFQVQTVCSGSSTSSYSASTNFTTSASSGSCSTPSGLSSSSVTNNSASISWTAVSGAASYNIRYKITSSSTWSTASSSSTSYSLTGLTASSTYEFQVQTVCSGSSSSAFSSSANFTTTAGITYCTSKGTNSSSEWIQQVQIGSINNTSGNNSGYANFTTTSTNLEQGSSNAITLTPGFTSGVLGPNAYPEYWRIYVDFNQDGDFVDAGELAFDAGATSTTTKTGSLVVPSGATLGATRMRVQMKYNAAPTSCETFADGEVEDYTATIIVPPTCNVPTGLSSSSVGSTTATLSWTAVSGAASYNVRYKLTSSSTWTTVSASSTSYNASGLTASSNYEFQVQTVCSGSSSSAFSSSSTFTTSAATCNVPSGLSTSGIGSTTATISWTAVSGAASYNIQYKLTSSSTWSTATSSSTSYNLTGLTASSNYEFQVQTVCSGSSSSAFSSSATFTTGSASVTYCTSKGTNSSSEWIQQVQIGSINNTSGNNSGYANFTTTSTNLTQGASVSVTLTPGFTSGLLGPNAYPEYWRIYVDFNQDGDFVDAGELAFDAGSTSTTTKTGTLTVPSGATLGATRMRVQMKYNAAPTSCETFADGEVEDYTATIVAPSSFLPQKGSQAATTSFVENNRIELYPNPASEMVTLRVSVKEVLQNAKIRVFDLQGRTVLEKTIETIDKGETSLNLETGMLNEGVYMIGIFPNEFKTLQKMVIVK